MAWNKIANITEDKITLKQEILFVCLYKGSVIEEYVGTLTSAKNFRRFQLEHTYTHYLLLPKYPRK